MTVTAALAGGSVASTIRSAMETLMTAHDNWTFIETITSVTDYTINVWKNSGSGAGANDFGQDFYVLLACNNTGAGTNANFRVYVAEDYISSTDSLIRPVAGNSGTPAINANFSYGNESTGVALTDVAVSKYDTNNSWSTNINYVVQVTKNYLLMAGYTGGTTRGWFVGLFDSALTGVSPVLAEPFPLFAAHVNTTPIHTSRHPGRVAAGSKNFQHYCANDGIANGFHYAQDLWHGSSGARRLAILGGTQNTDADIYGGLRGYFKGVRRLEIGATAPATLDQVRIDGDLYFACGLNGLTGVWWPMGAE